MNNVRRDLHIAMTRNYSPRECSLVFFLSPSFSLAPFYPFYTRLSVKESTKRLGDTAIGTLILLPPPFESQHPSLLHPVFSVASSLEFLNRQLTRRVRKTIMSNHIIDRPWGSSWSLPLFKARRMAFDSPSRDFP